jgi:hypothetical protein
VREHAVSRGRFGNAEASASSGRLPKVCGDSSPFEIEVCGLERIVLGGALVGQKAQDGV